MRDFTLSLRALIAQFVHKNVLVTGVVLTALVFFISDLVPVFDITQIGFVIGVASILFCRTLFDGWLCDGRLRHLLFLPFSESTVALAALVVATGIYVIEGVIPLVVFLTMKASGDLAALALVITYVLVTAMTVFAVSMAGHGVRISVAYLVGLVLVAVAYCGLGFAILAGLVITVICLVMGLRLPRDRDSHGRKPIAFGRQNYFLVTTLSDSRLYSSILFLGAFAAVISWPIVQEGAPALTFLFMAAVNTVCTTMLSRNIQTLDMITVIGDTRRSALRLFTITAVVFFIQAAFPVGVGLYLHALSPGEVLYAAVIIAFAAAAATYMEFRYPLRAIKSDRDAFRHPRKYLVPALVFAATALPQFLAA